MLCGSNLKSIEDFRANPIYAGNARTARQCRLRFGPRGSRRARRATRSLRVILRTKEVGNDNKSILMGRLTRLGSESEPIGKANDLLSKTQHSSLIAAGSLEGIEGHAKAFCAVRRHRPCSQTRASRL